MRNRSYKVWWENVLPFPPKEAKVVSSTRDGAWALHVSEGDPAGVNRTGKYSYCRTGLYFYNLTLEVVVDITLCISELHLARHGGAGPRAALPE